jgi:hypothetical protein
MDNDHASADDRHVKRPGYAISPCQSHLPEFILKMFDVGLSNPLKPDGFYSFSQPQKRRLHIPWQR